MKDHRESNRELNSLTILILDVRELVSGGIEQLTELPTFAVFAPNVLLGIGSIGGSHLFCVPVDFFASAIGDVAEVVGLG